MIPKSLKKKITIEAFRAANRLSKNLGYDRLCRLMNVMAELQIRFARRRVEAVKKNFRMLRGDETGWQETFRYFWSSVADTLILPHVSGDWVRAKLERMDGLHHAEPFRGKGLIVVSAHLGNPEFLANVAGILGFKGVAAAEVPSGEWFREFLRIRERFGLKIVPVKGSYPKLLEALRRGETVYLVSDRKVSSKEGGYVIRVGRGYRRVPTGFARLSLETGAPVVFAYGVPLERCGKYYGEVSPPFHPKDLDDAMEWFSRHLTEKLSRWTDRWFVFWDEWLEDRSLLP
ncbi:MAG: lysophospholipid acyltransferase family protein [Thermotogae bacterium]|nr:lysophospholipid acyltransferase family protein [Thermotogota bacterium]